MRDPEVKYSGETAIASFSIAVRRKFHKQGEQDSDFFDCKAFGKSAEFIEKHVSKGVKVEITGRIQQDTWTTQEGQKRQRVTIIADSIEFAESKNASQQSEPQSHTSAPKQSEPQKEETFMQIPDSDMESLPFN